MNRTHYCGVLRAEHVGHDVALVGWVHRRRDHGGLAFIDLRDRTGLIQIVVTPETEGGTSVAHEVRSEYVLEVTGKVKDDFARLLRRLVRKLSKATA